MARIRILMLTHNRPGYTKMSLERLCATMPHDGRVTVWDNASNPATHAVLRPFESHPKIEKIIYSKTNEKLRPPTNWFWENSKDAHFLGKVDDDCLVPDGWCEKLIEAHTEIPQTGALACWHFLEEDFDQPLASKKIHNYGRHQIMRNCWVEGSGYLMKRQMVDKLGLLRERESFSTYCTRGAVAGFINGWYFPFLYQDHMDDPRSPHTAIRTEAEFQQLRPLSAQRFQIKSREHWIERMKDSARMLQACSFEPKHYLGWRAEIRRKFSRLTGRQLLPRA